jgi:hypothetical protein
MSALITAILWLAAVVAVAQLYHLEREYQVLFSILRSFNF